MFTTSMKDILSISTMTEMFNQPLANTPVTRVQNSTPKSKATKQRRAKNKAASKARKLNRK